MMISAVRGDTLELEFLIEDENGTAFDLTGCTIKFTIRKDYDDPDIIFQNEIVPEEPESGYIKVVVDSSVTKDLSGVYVFDIEITTADNKVITPVVGKIKFIKDVTW